MAFLLNLLFAVLAGCLARIVLAKMGVTDPVNILLAVVIGVIVFLLNLASYVLTDGRV